MFNRLRWSHQAYSRDHLKHTLRCSMPARYRSQRFSPRSRRARTAAASGAKSANCDPSLMAARLTVSGTGPTIFISTAIQLSFRLVLSG